MQDFLDTFKRLVKSDEIRTDNNVFKLHYKFSVILLIVYSILLSSKQYFGEPIDCDVSYQKEMVNVYCWVTGTFILKQNIEGLFEYDSLNGLGHNPSGSNIETFTLKYYQWICLIFCFQALLFYIPRYLWKTWEGDRFGQLVKDLREPLVVDKWSSGYKQKISQYILGMESHDIFAYRFAFCEVLNLINLIVQISFMDWYLNGKFASYGYNVATKPWPTVMNEVFPKRTKCIYTNYGPSGSAQTKDALCLLPLNILNEKFFLILWYWVIILLFVTFGALVYRAMFIYWAKFRVYLLMAQVRRLNKKKATVIGQHLTHGQFFLLYNMGKKLNPLIYKELLFSVYDQIGNNHKLDNTLDI